MQPPNWTEFLQCCVCTNTFDSTIFVPISLSCGHTLCVKCLAKLKTRVCPYDKTPINPMTERLPKNYAILQLLNESLPGVEEDRYPESDVGISSEDRHHFLSAMRAIDQLALFLQPLADQGINSAVTHLTKPMLKKLVCVVNCQTLEVEGRARSLRAVRSIADRTVTELLVLHQNNQQISTLLWTAVRNRGCQFLGAIMQEEALKFILVVLSSGKFLARKTIVLYVVQKLQRDFPQASKTSVGHVVQLLYRASCFNVEKREDDSSLMQLKEEFRSYELLRHEHDSQIIRMAMEAGLRISPEQWSNFLYGDHKHKSDMQSIIDKLISLGAASSGLSELIVSVGRSQDPYNISEKIIPHLESLLKIDITNTEDCVELATSWSAFSGSMDALLGVLQGFSTFMQIQSGRFKTGLCPLLGKPDGCPKGGSCTYAHTEEERDHYRTLSKGNKVIKARTEPIKAAASLAHPSPRGRYSSDHGSPRADISAYPPLGGYQNPRPPNQDHYHHQSSSQEGSFESGLPLGYPCNDDQVLLQSVYSSGQSPNPSLQMMQQVPPSNVQPPQYRYPSGAAHYHTAPVATPTHLFQQQQQQVWYEEPRNVLATAQSYYGGQDQRRVDSGGISSNTGDQMYQVNDGRPYQKSLTEEQSVAYGQNDYVSSKPSIADQLTNLRRLHEFVKQSVQLNPPQLNPPQHEAVYAYETTPIATCTDYPSNPCVYDDNGRSYKVIQGEADWETYSKTSGYVGGPQSEIVPEDDGTNPVSSATANFAPSEDVDGRLSYPTRPIERYAPYAGSSDPAGTSGSGLERDNVGGASTSRGLVSESQSSSPQVVYSGSSSVELESRMSEINLGKTLSPETTYHVPSISRSSSHDHVTSPSHYVGGEHIDPVSSGCSLADSNSNDPSSSLPAAHPAPSVHVMSRDSRPPTTSDYLYNTRGQTDGSAGTVTVSSYSNYPIPSAVQSKEDELRDKILRLERELKEKDAKIEQQQKAQVRWSGPEVVQVTPRPVYDPPEAGSGMMESPHHSGVIQQLSSYSGPVSYSPHATMQHQYPQHSPLGDYQIHPPPLGSMSPRPSPTLQNAPPNYYTPQRTPPPTISHQWSGPVNASTGRRFVSPLNTMHQAPLAQTGSGYMVQPQQTGGYIVPGMNSDDEMIATYLQVLEQEKAAAAVAGGYHHVYNNGRGGYSVQQNPPPPLHRHPYPGSFR